MDVKRGDIVYVEIPYATGHEMMKDRPAVVVSNNAQNYAGEVVSVIYMTGSQKADRPYHVEVKGAMSLRHGPSTALCENIYTVDKSRLGKIMGSCSEEEMAAIDNGILLTLDLGDRERRIENTRQTPPPEPDEDEEYDISVEDALWVELETYKRLYGELLDRVMGGAAT